jgi:integrase
LGDWQPPDYSRRQLLALPAQERPHGSQSLGASLSKGARREKTKRPPTEAEIVTLLACDDVDLKDAATWAALTGMRLSEIIGLRVSDVSGGWITIRHGKTAAAARRLPLHSGLVAIAERRTADKAPTVLLWDRNAATISKRYTRWRRACGIAMGGDGRQASVDFHSWRRFFQTEARNAGIDLGTVQAIVGQKPNNLVDGTYRGSVADALLRACVEAVKLPAE